MADNNIFYNPFDPNQTYPATTLGVSFVRRTVSWNVVDYPNSEEYEALLRWVNDTAGVGTRIVSFEKCRGGKPNGPTLAQCERVPSPQEYIDAITRFRRNPNFASINVFSAWNEPNYGLQMSADAPDPDPQPTAYLPADGVAPTYSNSGAYAAGVLYRNFMWHCTFPPLGLSPCTVAAGEFYHKQLTYRPDRPRTDGQRFLNHYKKGLGGFVPYAWAWHAYRDGQRRPKTTNLNDAWPRLRKFLRATAATNRPVWLLEQGVVWSTKSGPAGLTSETASDIARCYIHELPKVSKRITRFAYYQYLGDRGDYAWDSGLLDVDDEISPGIYNARDEYYLYRDRATPQNCPR